MAKKPTVTTVSSGFASNTQLNNNFTEIRNAFDNTLSLDGSTPNAMQADLDLNGNALLNVGSIDVDNLTLNGQTVTELSSVPEWRSAWQTGTSYVKNDLVRQDGNAYICLITHTSGTFSTDLSAGLWELFAEKGAAGAGTGDMIGANNLSDVVDKPAALATLGGQPLNGLLTDISSLTDPNADRLLFWDDSVGDIGWLSAGSGITISGTTISAGGVPAGAIMPFAMNTAPTGWLKANGAAVSRTTFADLFAAIGTTYGSGDGVSTFNLPDLRGEFVRGWADDRAGVPDSGRSFGTSQTDQNKAHTHTGSTSTGGAHTHTIGVRALSGASSGSNAAVGENSALTTFNSGSSGSHSHTLTINSDGGTEARPLNVALLYCIKT